MKILIALVALAMTAVNATAHTIDDDFAATPRKDQLRRPGFPMLAVERGLRPPTRAELRLLNAASPRTALPYDCSVDFSDFDALSMIPEQAYAVAGAPWWFQNCGGSLLNYAVVRPLQYSHFHLNFEDETINCLAPDGTFGRLQPDNSCSSAGITHALEPRSLQSHWGDEYIHVYVVNWYVNPNDPYSDSTYDKKPFDLKRLRVLSTPVRVCYKKVQEVEGPWIASPDVHQDGSTPGVWLCWNHLGPRLWDLSAWAANVREVKITATDGVATFHIDDILIGVQ